MSKTIQEIASMSLGEIIKFYRESKGFTQAQMAEMLGISVASVVNYESDRTLPDVLLMRKMILLLKIPSEFVFIREYQYIGVTLYRTGENVFLDENGMPVCLERVTISSEILDFYEKSKWMCCCIEVCGKVYLLCDDTEELEGAMILARCQDKKAFRLMMVRNNEFTDVVTGKKCTGVKEVAARVLGEITEYNINPPI